MRGGEHGGGQGTIRASTRTDGGHRTAYWLSSVSVPGLNGHLLRTSTAAASNERCSRVGPEGRSISAFATRPEASIVKRMRVVPVTSARSADLGYSGFARRYVDPCRCTQGSRRSGRCWRRNHHRRGRGGTELAVMDGCESAG